MPRLRPPYVAQVGLVWTSHPRAQLRDSVLGARPLEKGAAAFASQGRNGRKGLRSFSVSGRVREPGVKLAPAGITIRELIDEFCGGMAEGHRFYGYLPGGASGGIRPRPWATFHWISTRCNRTALSSHPRPIIVLSDHDTAKAPAPTLCAFSSTNLADNARLAEWVRPRRARSSPSSAGIDRCWLNYPVMRDASICGLGQAAPNPVDCVIKYFPNEVS